MCLSNVYKDGCAEYMFRNVAGVEINGNELCFTDLMGVKNTVTGTIVKIDLIENIIIIKENGQ